MNSNRSAAETGRGPFLSRIASRTRLRGASRGQTAVEFAASALVFLLILIGIVNFALALYAYSFVSYAARDATRYASVRGSQSSSPATAAQVAAFVAGEATDLNTGDLTVNTTWSPNDNPGSTVKVAVTYSFTFTEPFSALGPVALSSTSRTIISQ